VSHAWLEDQHGFETSPSDQINRPPCPSSRCRLPPTLAHSWLADGGSEVDLMHIAGWRSHEMGAYGDSAADERARAAHRRLSRGDQIVRGPGLVILPSVLLVCGAVRAWFR
jgi:hypothetical protein